MFKMFFLKILRFKLWSKRPQHSSCPVAKLMCRANLIPVHPICSDFGQKNILKTINDGLAPSYQLLKLLLVLTLLTLLTYIAVWFQRHIGKMGFWSFFACVRAGWDGMNWMGNPLRLLLLQKQLWCLNRFPAFIAFTWWLNHTDLSK